MISCAEDYFGVRGGFMKNVKLFLFLLGGSIVVTFLVLPYTLALSPEVAKLFSPTVFIAQILQSTVIYALAIYFGLRLSEITGFKMEVLAGKKPIGSLKSVLGPATGLGILAGILILGSSFLFPTLSGVFGKAEAGVETWKAFLASFYGGFAEEILFRLFMVNFFVWFFMKIVRSKTGEPPAYGVWTAIVTTSVLFGLGHLGITGAITDITPSVVLRAVLLNGIGGVIFGWLYWKKGLESAMISHFSADIVLHVIAPLVVPLIMGV